MQLILDSKGIIMRKRNGCFHLQTEKHERLISPERVSSIAVTSNCMLSSAAIRLAIKHLIPIYLMGAFGNVEARLWSPSFGHLSTFRRKQVHFYESVLATKWVIDLFELKTSHQLDNLIFLKNRKIAQTKLIEHNCNQMEELKLDFKYFAEQKLSECTSEMMGKEGIIARFYWGSLAVCMPDTLTFETRNRQPAEDNFNAALNYVYGMLYGIVETAIFSVGLDPYLGFLHADQYDKPTLSFDMIEPFRPWIDRLLIDLALKDELTPQCFMKSPTQANGVWLSSKGKQLIIPAFNAYLAEKCIFGDKIENRKTHIYQFAFRLVKILDKFEK